MKDSYAVQEGENLKYCHYLDSGATKDCYDYYRFSIGSELVYESMGCGVNVSRLNFCFHCYPSDYNLTYCAHCLSSHDLWGCFGLRNKQYCILNKQYTKDEYEKLLPRIIEHMNEMPYVDQEGKVYKYGEFFPPNLSPLTYNESIAFEYAPLTEEAAQNQGYRWSDPDKKEHRATRNADELPEDIREVGDDILKEVISCAHKGECAHSCATAFKIIPQELAFYRQYGIPLPRLCFACRHNERIQFRNSHKLTHQKCRCGGEKSQLGGYQNATSHFHGGNPCPNEFQTSKGEQEIVYCEQCYQAEVA